MIRHLLKMVWNRKRANFLIIVEIFFSFLVLAGVSITAFYYLQNYQKPLGFDYDRVWRIELSNRSEVYSKGHAPEDSRQLYQTLENLPEMEAFSGSSEMPYIPSWNYEGFHYKGKDFAIEHNYVTPSFKEVMGLQLTDGRWFQEGDETLNWDPVVITQALKEQYFSDEDPLGKNVAPIKAEREKRIIGIVAAYRMHGEFTSPLAYSFRLNRWTGKEGNKDNPPGYILVKVRPGITAAFEEKLLRRLQAVNQDWSFTINPLAESRRSWLTFSLVPVICLSTIALFLIIMVGLGLVGVLWQNVTQRTREIGLRRALGGTSQNVYLQILGELLLIATIGLLAGTLLVIQLPLLHVIDFLGAWIYSSGIALSALLIYGLTLICGLYPSWLAARVQPAEALHYE
jgi:putative ABC transport system permease protein